MATEAWDDDFDLGDEIGPGNSSLTMTRSTSYVVGKDDDPSPKNLTLPTVRDDFASQTINLDDAFDFDSDDDEEEEDGGKQPLPPATSSPDPDLGPLLPTGNDGRALVGIAADPTTTETWDDDFDLAVDDDDEKDAGSEKKIGGEGGGSSSKHESSDRNSLTLPVQYSGEEEEEEDWDAEFEVGENDLGGGLGGLVKAETTKKTGNEDEEEESEEEDWDAELTIHPQRRRIGTPSLMMTKKIVEEVMVMVVVVEEETRERERIRRRVSSACTWP